MTKQRLFAIVLCVVSSACSSSSEKLTKELKEANSWLSSVHMIADSYVSGAVPGRYARDAIEAFDQQLQSSGKRLQSISDVKSAQAAATVQQAQQTISQMSTAIKQSDHLSLTQLSRQLEIYEKSLATLVESQTEQSQQR